MAPRSLAHRSAKWSSCVRAQAAAPVEPAIRGDARLARGAGGPGPYPPVLLRRGLRGPGGASLPTWSGPTTGVLRLTRTSAACSTRASWRWNSIGRSPGSTTAPAIPLPRPRPTGSRHRPRTPRRLGDRGRSEVRRDRPQGRLPRPGICSQSAVLEPPATSPFSPANKRKLQPEEDRLTRERSVVRNHPRPSEAPERAPRRLELASANLTGLRLTSSYSSARSRICPSRVRVLLIDPADKRPSRTWASVRSSSAWAFASLQPSASSPSRPTCAGFERPFPG